MSSQKKRIRRVPLVAIGTVFFVTGVMGTRPLVPMYSAELGIGPEEIGVLVAVFALIPLVLAAIAGSWMDRHGTGRALVFGTLVGAVGLMLPYFLPGRAGLYLSQLIAGSGFTVFILAAQNFSGRGAGDAWSRERSVAVFSMGVALGSLFGPLIGGVVGDHIGYGWAFLGLGLLPLVALTFVLPTLGADRIAEQATAAAPGPGIPNPLRILGYHRYMGRAFLISSLVLMAKDMYVAYFPLYGIAAGLSVTWIGVIIALHNGGGVVMRFFMLPLVRLMGKDRVIILSILFSGVCFLLLPLTDELVPLAVISVALGLGLGLGQPLSITRTINLAPPDKVGEVLGFRLACNRSTQLVTPLAIGGLVIFTGVSGVFVVIGVAMGLGSTRLSVPAEVETPGPVRKD